MFAPVTVIMSPGTARPNPLQTKPVLWFYALRFVLSRINLKQCLHLWSEKRQTTSATLLKTLVWIISDKFFKYKNMYFQTKSEVPDFTWKVGTAPLYRTTFEDRPIVGYSEGSGNRPPYNVTLRTSIWNGRWTWDRHWMRIGLCYAKWHRHGRKRSVLGGRGQVLTLIKNISLDLRL